MTTHTNTALDKKAKEILIQNDRGGYTVPTHGLYPFQWNWDSAFVALGLQHIDADRAWQEMETLMAAQWQDGMVPHIIFHKPDAGYFPGPTEWGSTRVPPTSGISQPPVAATMLRRLLASSNPPDRTQRARKLARAIFKWHCWFRDARLDPAHDLVFITHPWESGRDNSPDWDIPLGNVDDAAVADFVRRDTGHVDAAQRPSQTEYRRYMALVKFGVDCAWDIDEIRRNSPFRAADPGLISILCRANKDLAFLLTEFGMTDEAGQINAFNQRLIQGMESLWNEDQGSYFARDLISGAYAAGISTGGYLTLFGRIPTPERAAHIIGTLERLADRLQILAPSYDPDGPGYDSKRYWRGPVWLHINRMIADGLRAYGRDDLADRIHNDCRKLVESSGFHEYFDPETAAGLGGKDFSWTAALWLDWAGQDPDPDRTPTR